MADIKSRIVKALIEQLNTSNRVQVPAGGELIWKWFHDLNRTRTMHAAGVNPLQATEIEAYCRLHRWPVERHHIEILEAMDDAYLDYVHAGSKPLPEGTKKLEPYSKREMSAALFDVMTG